MIKDILDQKSHDCDPEKRSLCEHYNCSLFSFCTKKIVRKSMIREYCRQCMNGLPSEIRACLSTDCPFYSFRMGKDV